MNRNRQGRQEATKFRRTIICFGILAVLIFGVPIGIYTWNFFRLPISKEPEAWGQFGDYLGGVINPLVSLLNLFVVIWLARVIFKLETEREEKLQAITVRPRCVVHPSDYENMIKVTVKNLGIGPAIIKEVKIINLKTYHTDRATTKDLLSLMPTRPPNIYWRDYTNGIPEYIPAGETVNLVWLEGEIGDPTFVEYRDKVRKALKSIAISISYSDMFGNDMEPTGGDLSFFGRHFSKD